MDKQKLLYKALISRFEAQRDAALATIQVYLDDSAGIGEHPQIVDEMAKQVESLAAADDALKTLFENFNEREE